jgi:thiol:disulfide interchange protein DsbA
VLGRHWTNHARAYYAAELLGVLGRTHLPLFAALHEKKLRLGDEDSIADWFATQGVDRQEFLKAYRSFVVDMKVRRAQQFGVNLGLDGVPTFLVNGKYLTSPSMTGGSARMFTVIDELTAMEAGAAGEAAGSETAAAE